MIKFAKKVKIERDTLKSSASCCCYATRESLLFVVNKDSEVFHIAQNFYFNKKNYYTFIMTEFDPKKEKIVDKDMIVISPDIFIIKIFRFFASRIDGLLHGRKDDECK